MNHRFAALGIAGSLLIGLAGCDETQSPESAAPSQPTQASAPPEPAPPTDQRWPFAGPAEDTASATAFTAETLMATNYYVVFDASGSMAESRCSGESTKLAVAKQAFADFAEHVPLDANLGLSVFHNQQIQELLPLARVEPAAANAVVAEIDAGGPTPLSESIDRAYFALTEQGRKQMGYGEYHLIVLTDGSSTDGDPQAVVDRVLTDSPVIIHTIGFCIGTEHSLNQPGQVLYRQAGSAAELAEGFSSVLAEAPSFDVQSFQ